MVRKLLLAAVVVLGWAGLGECVPAKDAAVSPPLGCRLELRFSSEVPDAYYVMSGPAQSYRRHRVNDDLRKALEAYAARASGSGEAVGIHVNLKAVKTSFKQEGALPPKKTPKFAENASAGPIILAATGASNSNIEIPQLVRKGVVLVLEADVYRSGREPKRLSWESSATDEITRETFDLFAYNYQNVIETAIRNAVTDLDRLLRDALK